MAEVTVSTTVGAPLAEVWSSWDDFGGIANFNPNLKRSFLLEGSSQTGLGATRQCDFADGKNHIRERIIDYVAREKLVIDIYEGSVPLKSAVATIRFASTAGNGTRVTMSMEFVPKFGVIGAFMVPMMKSQFAKSLRSLLDSNARFVERRAGVAKAA